MTERDFADGTRLVAVEQPSGTTELLLELDGRRVSRVVIVPMLMRIGSAVVRMDGIGGVSTEEEYQNRGYSRRLMEAAVARMRMGDAALSTLFGIEDFYPKFGYATTGPEHAVGLPLDDAAAERAVLPPGWQVRPLAVDDLPALMRLYHANTRRATGALVRHETGDESAETERLSRASSTARRIGLRAWNRLRAVAVDPGEDECRVLLDETGTVAAYAWFGAKNWWMFYRRREVPAAFHLAEVMARDPVAAEAVLVACRAWAAEAGNAHNLIALALPPDGPVAWAAAYEGGRFFSIFTREGDFMGRVLDIDHLVRQLLPEFTVRIRASRLHVRGWLTVRTEEGEASLRITPDGAFADGPSGGTRLIVELPQATLARLCLGGFATSDLVARLPSAPAPEVVALLELLFPKRAPHIYPMDRF